MLPLLLLLPPLLLLLLLERLLLLLLQRRLLVGLPLHAGQLLLLLQLGACPGGADARTAQRLRTGMAVPLLSAVRIAYAAPHVCPHAPLHGWRDVVGDQVAAVAAVEVEPAVCVVMMDESGQVGTQVGQGRQRWQAPAAGLSPSGATLLWLCWQGRLTWLGRTCHHWPTG